jgi:hypothetical protein
MAQENVVVVRFVDRGNARQALNALKECNADDRIGLAVRSGRGAHGNG